LGGLVWLLGRVSKMGWMKVPFLGKPFRDEFCARFFSTLGLLSGHGVALNEAVDWALQTAGCPPLFADAVGRDLSSGEELSRVMGRLGAFPREDLEVMALAQRTAAISETSTRLGRIHQERYEIGMRGLLGVVEPALVVVMALSVAVLVGALFAPLLPLISRLSEGV
jgi:type II secretory pathway component PulF